VSYDYKIFNAGGRTPSLEELAESPIPFESYDSARSLLSDCFPGIVWHDATQRGILENDIGRFEFDCDGALLTSGVISLSTSHRQDVAASHHFLTACHAQGLAVLDEQTMAFISAT
jgi:hypothetical protein